jgi:hypothetical protein
MLVNASLFNPCIRLYRQQGVNRKHVLKNHRNFVGANNLGITLSSFAKSSNKIEILKLEAQKETIERAVKKFLNAQVQIVILFVKVLKPRAIQGN